MAQEDPNKKTSVDDLLRKAAAEKYGLGSIVEDIEKVKPLLEKVNTLQDFIKGEPGYSPVAGKDFLTDDEQTAILKAITPVKGKDYDDGAPGIDGITPQKGLDYLTDSEMEEIRQGAKPVKGVDYFTDGDVNEIKAAVTPKKGVDYVDGANPTPQQFIEIVKSLKGKDAASFSEAVGAKIDISHVRNAGAFIFNGKKYKTEELMHGGGQGGGGGSVQSVTGLHTDNTDPSNPIVKISVDGVTITGQGTPGDPLVSSGGGITGISISTANGFAGLSDGDPNTPTITLSTTVTGILQGNGTAISAASTTGTGAVVLATGATLSSPIFVTPALGTPASGVMTNVTGTASGLTSGITLALKSATTTVNVSSATAPTSGQVLTATGGTAATWQTPSGGDANAFAWFIS